MDGRLSSRHDSRTAGRQAVSVPKSVSLAYGLTQDEGLVTAFRTAVNDTMQEIEAEMKVRVRKGSQNHDRVSGNAAWATFVHTTARPVGGVPDPHLHAHCFVFSASLDRQENVWKAGQFRDLKRDAPYWQAAFRARLAQNLQARGYALNVSQGKGDFELAGLSRPTIGKFSRRTALVEQTAEDLGITDPTIKSGLGATTREGKRGGLTWDDLKRDWDSRLTPAERETITAARARTGMFPVVGPAGHGRRGARRRPPVRAAIGRPGEITPRRGPPSRTGGRNPGRGPACLCPHQADRPRN